MARATRSRRQLAHSQPSQLQPRRGVANGRSQHMEEDEDDKDDDVDAGGDIDEDAMDVDGDGAEDGDLQKELDRKAGDLARLALFAESRPTPLKRDEISKKVLGSSSRQFNVIFNRAQELLRKTFGVEIVELSSRAALAQDGDEPEPTANGVVNDNEGGKRGKRGAAAGKKAPAGGAKTYIVRSLLDPSVIAHANAPDRQLRQLENAPAGITSAELADLYDAAENSDDDNATEKYTGSILAWERSDEPASIGVLYVVLALVLVEGRVISDHELRQILKRMRLGPGAEVPLTARATAPFTVDPLLISFVRQGYLDRQRTGDLGKAKAKRGRGTQVPGGGAGGAAASEEQWEWRWGPRAHAEVGEKAIGRFIAEFMVDVEMRGPAAAGESDEDAGEEDGEERKKRVQRVYNGVERAAAGAALQDVK